MKDSLVILQRKIHLLIALCGLLPAAWAQGPFAGGGYGGPSILSRGGNKAGYRGNAPMLFRWWGGIGGTYETGLLFPTVDASGALIDSALYGVSADIGAYGTHEWRRSVLGLDYRGDYRHYNRNTFYNGSDHALNINYAMQPTRRFDWGVTQTGGTTSRAFGGFTAPSFYNQDLIGVPTSEVFDSRLYYSNTSLQGNYRRSARMIYGAQVDGFLVRRRANSLVGLNGYRVVGRAERLLSRRTQVGLNYQFLHFGFPGIFGASDIHGLTAQYRSQITRTFQLAIAIGAYRLESLGTQRVTIAPEVAAILGRTTGVEAFYKVNYVPQGEIALNWKRENHGASASYVRGVQPGNGIFLTSTQENLSSGYSYTGIRKWSFGANAGYSRFNSVFQDVGGYKSVQAGGGLSYAMGKGLGLTFQTDARKFSSGRLDGRSGVSVRLGITYSGSDLPLSLW